MGLHMKKRTTASHNGVRVAPVKMYKTPKYPTQAEAFGDPELLKNLPPSWVKNATVTVAAGLLVACSSALCVTVNGNDISLNGNNEKYLNVAPVFEHGSGTGSMGCVMVVPPVFLSEQDALAVIRSAAEGAGISFNDTPPGHVAASNRMSSIRKLGNGRVELKLFDEKNGVAAAFIEMRSAEETIETTPKLSVSNYNALGLARLTADDFARQNGDIVVGVFYDPGIRGENAPVFQRAPLMHETKPGEKTPAEYQQEYINDATEFLKTQLRNQVLDFLEWLKAQGII